MAKTKKIMERPSDLVLSNTIQKTVSGEELFHMMAYEANKYTFVMGCPSLDDIDSNKKYIIYCGEEFKPLFNVTEEKKCFVKYIEEVVQPLSKEEQEKWEQVRNNAAISIMNSLLETTEHSVVLEPAANAIYSRVAVAYADSLIKELRNKKDWIEKILEA